MRLRSDILCSPFHHRAVLDCLKGDIGLGHATLSNLVQTSRTGECVLGSERDVEGVVSYAIRKYTQSTANILIRCSFLILILTP